VRQLLLLVLNGQHGLGLGQPLLHSGEDGQEGGAAKALGQQGQNRT
jgi:hypothetical protein